MLEAAGVCVNTPQPVLSTFKELHIGEVTFPKKWLDTAISIP